MGKTTGKSKMRKTKKRRSSCFLEPIEPVLSFLELEKRKQNTWLCADKSNELEIITQKYLMGVFEDLEILYDVEIALKEQNEYF